MSFESMVLAFGWRFLSHRTFDLVVAPAVADLEFDPGTGRLRRAANRLAVLKAIAGGLHDDVMRDIGSFAALTLVPCCYYVVLMILFVDFFSIAKGFLAVATLILVLSLGPVMVCFWPERPTVRPVD